MKILLDLKIGIVEAFTASYSSPAQLLPCYLENKGETERDLEAGEEDDEGNTKEENDGNVEMGNMEDREASEQDFENRQSKSKAKYFSQVDAATHEDVKDTFLFTCQMLDLDLDEALPDNNVAMFGVLYFLTAYLFFHDYKKVVDHFLFVLVVDFNEMNSFSWGKLLFQITLGALRDGLSRRTTHYRLRGMIVAFQAWIYEIFPSLDGIVVTRISRVHLCIINWMADEQLLAAKLEGPDCFSNPKICGLEPLKSEMAMPCMNGVQYNKLIQLTSSSESWRRTKRRTERTSERGVRQTEALGVGDQEHHVAGGSDKAQEVEKVVSNVDRKGKGKIDPSDDLPSSLEPPSFDLGNEYTPPDVLHSKEIQKRVDSIIFDVVTTTKTV
ncbi:Hypothetical predicted protein [Olea europaea subsp. europaea]|uniref:Uncharacterized protein n=1 Tax=Olea europaea subsp. europaea TaxID=158383 RepID=A0A8S0TU22_OLEEU|nr:Hypothetical predicted protein [Olea europaea subsp. europaea]